MARIRAFIMNNIFWIGIIAALTVAVGGLFFAISNQEPEKSASGIANLLFLKLAFAGLIIGSVKSRENTKIAATLMGTAIIVLLIIVGKFETFFSGSSSSINNMIWVVLIAGLVAAAVIAREQKYLAGTFVTIAGLIFLVMLGKIDVLFGWAILGLPIFAVAGFYGSTKVTGGAKTFLGFASGVIVLSWMYMFYQDGHQIKGLGFFNETIPMLFPDATAKTIFIIFAGLTGLALWKKSKIFGILATIVFLCFGSTLIDEMIERFPSKLKPSTEVIQRVEGAATGVVENIGKAIKSASAGKVDTREVIGSFPIFLSENSFNLQVGKNKERQGTGEIFIPHMCEAGYEYFFTVSGEYEKLFWRLPFKKISWQGNDSVAGQGVNKPFPSLRYGALTLRIGDKEGVFPSEVNGEIKTLITASTPLFAEVNINREIGEYLDTATGLGSKLKNSALSVKIERRRLIE